MEKCALFMEKVEKAIGVIMLAGLFVIISVNMIMRYFFFKPFLWAEEASKYLFVWFGMLASIYAISQETHVRFSALVNLCSKRVQRWFSIAMDILMLITFLFYIWPDIQMLSTLSISPALRLPESVVYTIIPAMFILMAVHVFINLCRKVASCKGGD